MAKRLITLLSLCLALQLMAKQAPQFQGETLDGKRVSLKQSLRPGRSLILCFWASWCTPCLQELKEVSTD